MNSKSSRQRAPKPELTPVALRHRHDGWTPEKQLGFIDALAECGCVAEAARAVGMAREGAYALRARIDGQSFRVAWDAALDFAIRRITDEAYSRALHGIVVPHFYKGEQVGEHRRYDNRLAMFLMRYRDPLRYARTLDQMVFEGHPEAAAIGLAKARDRLADDVYAGEPRGEDIEPSSAMPWTAALPSSGSPPADADAAGQFPTAEELSRRYYAPLAEEIAADDAMIGATNRTDFERARRRYELAVARRTGRSAWGEAGPPGWDGGG